MTSAPFLLLFVWTSLAAASPLPIDLVFAGMRIPSRVEGWAMKEAAIIWDSYDVDVRRAAADCPGRPGAIRIAVVFADRPGRDVAPNTLGLIHFASDRPEPAIVMYAGEVAAVVQRATPRGGGGIESSPLFRDFTLGRALGRALAHEIGHYLLRSRGHSSHGLMRARQPAYDLASPDRRGFFLSAQEVKRLESVRARPVLLESSGR